MQPSTDYSTRKEKFNNQLEDARVAKQQEDAAKKERQKNYNFNDSKRKNTAFVSSLSSASEKKDVSDVVYDNLMDYLFNKIVFINLAYSDLGGGGTTSTANFGKLSRIIDTAEGRLMAPGKNSRLRCQFYIKNPSKINGYILSPCVYDAQGLPTNVTTMTIFRSYVGLKFLSGQVYVVVKQAGKSEELYPISFSLDMYDATYTDTFALEIYHNILSTDIIINGVNYGSYTSDMVGSISVNETFYPFFSPAKSTDGTSVNIVVENIQFIQQK